MSITIRELGPDDVDRGLIQTLEVLAPVGLSRNVANVLVWGLIENHWRQRLPKTIIFVAENEHGRVVGTASLLILQKLIHGGGRCGQIEDVAVHEDWRGQGIATQLIARCREAALLRHCYKVVLSCNESNVAFYQSLGFRTHEVSMRLDLDLGAIGAKHEF